MSATSKTLLRGIAARKKQEQKLAEARRAGALIRFFLDGGNDSQMSTPEEGAICALAHVMQYIPEGEDAALIEAVGLEQHHTPMGALILRKKQ